MNSGVVLLQRETSYLISCCFWFGPASPQRSKSSDGKSNSGLVDGRPGDKSVPEFTVVVRGHGRLDMYPEVVPCCGVLIPFEPDFGWVLD